MEGYPILFHSQPNNIDMMRNSHLFGNLLASRNDSSSSALLAQGSKDEASPSQGNHQEGVMASTNGEVGIGEKASRKKGEKKVKRPRYAFQTRSQVDILDDGYRWRKYGQKAVKNNKFPRSYYRCTHQGCNVKKQVQRLSKDEGVVVTTYEGMHTHPIEKSNDNFEHILKQMQIYSSFCVQDKLEVN